MSQCLYEEVVDSDKNGKDHIKRIQKESWEHILKQVLVCSGVWTTFFQMGLVVGTPTVQIPQMRREANSSNFITQELASWLSSTQSHAALPWVPVLPAIAWYYGRRASHAVVVAFSMIGYTTLYFSTTLKGVFIGTAVLGVLSTAIGSIELLILTEYTSPINRGLFLTMKAASVYWGVWVANAIGTFSHWKNIAILGFLCGIYNAVTLLLWPESPYWLAARGHVERSHNAFKWARTMTEDSEKEIQELLELRKSSNRLLEKQTDGDTGIWDSVCSKWFLRQISLSALTIAQYQFSSKLVVSVYAIDIIKKITSIERNAYTGMLIIDGVTVFGMYCGCFLGRFVPRRVQLMSGTAAGIVCLLLMSLYMHLIKRSLVLENVYLSLALLSVLSLCVSLGPILMSTTISGELLSLKLRNLSAAILSLYINLSNAVVLKFGPSIFSTFGLDGAFLFFGLSSLMCLILVYKYLPETKGRTLLEISKLI